MTNPKVSVCMITYNHERFIAQAVESVLEQRTDFAYELVVGEDCSTDCTRDILIDYQNRFPDRIKLLLWNENQGLNGKNNFVKTLSECKGQYIALLEGDDYWIDPGKLQKQVDYLDNHRECAICFHNARIEYADVGHVDRLYCSIDQSDITNLDDILFENFIPTCSVVFRNGLIQEFPEWYFHIGIGDWPLFILVSQFGKIKYFNGVMGVYRIHSGGTWSGLNPVKKFQQTIEVYDAINSHFKCKFEKIIEPRVHSYLEDIAQAIVNTIDDHELVDSSGKNTIRKIDHIVRIFKFSLEHEKFIMGEIIKILLFRSFLLEDNPKSRYYFIKATLRKPIILTNRGALSLGLEAFVGKRIMSLIKKILGKRQELN